MRTQRGVGRIVVRHDVQRDLDSLTCSVDRDLLVQCGLQMLLVAPDHLGRGLDPGIESVGVEWFGVLFVATHGPGCDQSGLCLAGFVHRHRPAFVVLVLDHLSGPTVVAPQTGFVHDHRILGFVFFGTACVVISHPQSLTTGPIVRRLNASAQCTTGASTSWPSHDSIRPSNHRQKWQSVRLC